MIEQHWMDLCHRNRVAGALSKWKAISDAYSENTRFYHTLTHISKMLEAFHTHRDRFRHPEEVEMAIFLHDYVYDSRSKRNEAESAEIATRWVYGSLLQGEMVSQFIMDTLHTVEPASVDSKLLLDIDTQIFCANSDVYRQYAKNIRLEYNWVPEAIYIQERIKVLQSFLKKDHIFFTDIFGENADETARSNIRREIEALSG